LLKYLFLLFDLLSFIYCRGQSFQPLPVPSVARIGAYGSLQPNALHGAANQAALGAVKTAAAALYGEKRFLLQELALYHFALAQPAGAGAFGLQAVFAGNSDYSTSKVGVAYGMPLSPKVVIGVQLDYLAYRIRGYGNAARVAAEGAVLVHFSESLHAGFQVCHPAGIASRKGVANLPAVYTAGMEYRPSSVVILTAELIKTEQFPIAVQSGIEYRFAPQLSAKAGINSRTAAFFVAAGFGLKTFRMELIGDVHPQLGLTPGLLLLYNGMGK
jgi:hypothetical protein